MYFVPLPRPRTLILGTALFFALMSLTGLAQSELQEVQKSDQGSPWQVPLSQNPTPHFQRVLGHEVLFVNGRPFTALATEIPWWHVIYGRYDETESAYDFLYPAARALGLNALKVPVKWSMIEPREGDYDFSYVDHAREMAEKYHLKLVLEWFGHYASGDGNIYRNLTGEMFAPYYIVKNEKDYPRAIDGNGVRHHNAASYDYPRIIKRETAAFTAFMQHIKDIDPRTHTVVMIQVENEIAVFGDYPYDRKFWRDHSPASNKLFAEKGFTDDLKYSAWDLSQNWIRPLTNAGAAVYPIPFFLNFVERKLEPGIIGGVPGEDLQTYLDDCTHINFIGLNLYAPAGISSEDLKDRLAPYALGRNIPAVTETNSGPHHVAPRLAYIAIGDFGSPIVSPWALTVSSLTPFKPYVLSDGSMANGAFSLRDAFSALAMALAQVSCYGGTKMLRVFMAYVPGTQFSETKDVNGAQVSVSGVDNGQAIVIHPSGHQFLILGYRCWVTFRGPVFQWPAMKQVHVERGYFVGDEWKQKGAADYTIDETHKRLGIQVNAPQVIRVWW